MKILFAILSYLFGSFPTGYLIFRISEKKDIRDFGSKSMGATNVLRLKGLKYALPVVPIDLFKGFLPVFLALKLFPDKRFALLCAFLAVLGHCFPVYIKFRGGKGIATTMGAFSILAFHPFLLSLATFLLIIIITRYVSLGSLVATLSLPLYIYLFKGDIEIIYLSFAVFLIIFIRHLGNINRLIHGKERKLGEKAK